MRGNVSLIFDGDKPTPESFIFLHHDDLRVHLIPSPHVDKGQAELLAHDFPEDDSASLQQDVEEILKQPLVTLKNSTMCVTCPPSPDRTFLTRG